LNWLNANKVTNIAERKLRSAKELDVGERRVGA
jgi:hypothetical protein